MSKFFWCWEKKETKNDGCWCSWLSLIIAIIESNQMFKSWNFTQIIILLWLFVNRFISFIHFIVIHSIQFNSDSNLCPKKILFSFWKSYIFFLFPEFDNIEKKIWKLFRTHGNNFPNDNFIFSQSMVMIR